MDVTFFDIECYINFVLIKFKRDGKFYTFEKYNDKITKGKLSDVKALYQTYLVGYNSNGYDQPMLVEIIKNKSNRELKRMSDSLIRSKKQPWCNNKYSIDLMKLIFNPDVIDKKTGKKKISTKSLKHVGVILKHDLLQDLPIEVSATIKDCDIDLLNTYCENDVNITEKLFQSKYVTDLLEVRRYVHETYGIDCYSLSDSSLCNKLINLWYDAPYTKVKYGPFSFLDAYKKCPITFRTEEANKFLEDVLKLQSEDTIPDVKIFGVHLQFGKGGIHSKDKRGSFIEDDEYCYIDVDISSQYPTITINRKINPRHLDDRLLSKYKAIRDERLELKAAGQGKMAKAEVYKLILNSYVGKFLSEFSILYDPLCNLEVTLAGQLYILNLIEMLTLTGVQVISANTDGVTSKIKKTDVDKYYAMVNQWAVDNEFEVEYAQYKEYHRRDVNNYVTKDAKGYIKSKGIFNYKLEFTKGYNYPIVKEALQRYYIDKIDIEDFIKGDKDIYKFCRAQKIDKKFKVFYDDESVQHSCRWFVSNKGGELSKVKEVKDKTSKIKLEKNNPVTLFNDYYDADDYDIDYDFYIEQVKKNLI